MALRLATDDDWTAMFAMPAPGAWFGLVEASAWLVEGLGAVTLCEDGRWWITFARAPGIRKTKTAHTAAKKLIAMAKSENLTLFALADPAICGATLWIERLGFRRSGETREGIDVWTL